MTAKQQKSVFKLWVGVTAVLAMAALWMLGSRYDLGKLFELEARAGVGQTASCEIGGKKASVRAVSDGWDKVNGNYFVEYEISRFDSAIESVMLRTLSFYCTTVSASGECSDNETGQRLEVKFNGQDSVRQYVASFPAGEICGGYQIDAFPERINGQVCTRTDSPVSYGVCNTINASQDCGLAAVCAPTPTPTLTPTPTPTGVLTLTPTPTPMSTPTNTPTPTPTPTGVLTPTPTPTPTLTPTPTPTPEAANCVGISVSPNDGNKDLQVTAVVNGYSPRNEYKIEWGYNNQVIAAKSGSYTYTQTGIYTVVGYVRDEAGSWVTAANCGAQVRVTQPEEGVKEVVCGLSVSPATGLAPLAVRLTATGSSPNDAIKSYTFSYGDGAPVDEVLSDAASLSRDHAYTQAGDYTAVVVVKDKANQTKTCTVRIQTTRPGEVLGASTTTTTPKTGTAGIVTVSLAGSGLAGWILRRKFGLPV